MSDEMTELAGVPLKGCPVCGRRPHGSQGHNFDRDRLEFYSLWCYGGDHRLATENREGDTEEAVAARWNARADDARLDTPSEERDSALAAIRAIRDLFAPRPTEMATQDIVETEILRLTDRWRTAQLALESLTPGGSEFADNPARCVEHVREHMATKDALIGQWRMECGAARVQMEALEVRHADALAQLASQAAIVEAARRFAAEYRIAGFTSLSTVLHVRADELAMAVGAATGAAGDSVSRDDSEESK